MNDSEKFRHFSVINDFLRRHEDYTPSNREEYEKFKKQLLILNAPLKEMNKRDLLVRKKNRQLKNMFIETRKRFHAVERKKRSKGLVDITSPKVKAYLDEFNLVKKAANTPLPQPTPSPIEIEQEAEPAAVSCKSCFGRRKTKKKGKKSYDKFEVYGGKRRRRKKKKTRKKRGGVRRWTREILQPNPETFDDIGYFYDCKPMPHVGSTNKSKYREHMIIKGNRDENELMLPDKWKIIRMNDSEFYDPQLQLVDMREREGLRGMAAFRRRAQDLCNRGYKPLKRNDAKTGAGRKKKTRKKKGGMEEPSTPPRPPKDNDRGTNRYPPGFTLPPPQVSVRTAAQPQQVRMRRINREELTRDTPIGHRRPTQRMIDEHNERLRRSQNSRARNMAGDFLEACTGSRCGLGGRRRNKKTRKKRGGVKFGKNKTSAEIVKKGRELLKTTPQKKRIKRREQQIKLTGQQEFALFKKQALNQMRIAFIKSFGEPPSNMDKKILTLVYKFLKDEISKEETDFIEDYRAKNNENKRKLVWMNNSLRQLREKSEIVKHKIYNTGDDPEVIKKYRPRKKKPINGPATNLVVDTDKYMSPIKGPDTRYPRLSLDIGERSNRKLFKGGRKKKTRKNKNKKRRTKKKSRR